MKALPALRGAVAIGAMCLAFEVCAQVSGSVSLLSDYRFRGVSLTQQRPAAQLAVAYDHPSGWYAGVFGSNVQLADDSSRSLQAVSFVGYAQRLDSGPSWEAGADYSVFTDGGGYDYAEVYAGIASGNISSRLYYAPRYFGQNSGVLYAEVNGARPLLDRVQLLGHVGVLWRSGGAGAEGSDRFLFDARAGVGIDLEACNLQLTWVWTSAAATLYPVSERQHRGSVVLGLSRSF